MSNATIISTFNGDNSNIAYIKKQDFQIKAVTAYIILKFESMIKKRIMSNHIFFTFTTFGKINSFAYSVVIQLL